MRQLNTLSVHDMLVLNSVKFYYKYKHKGVQDYFASFTLSTRLNSTLARKTVLEQIERVSISLKNVFGINGRKR